VQLLGEEVNTQVSVLASGRGGGDTDDLARAALEDQEITETDVVAWDGDGVWGVGGLGNRASRSSSWSCRDVNVNLFPVYVVVMMVMGTSQHAVSSLVETVTEGVVVAWVDV
jgi:hypothetical protein